MELAVVLGACMAKKETRGSRGGYVGAASKSDGPLALCQEVGGRQRGLHVARRAVAMLSAGAAAVALSAHAEWRQTALQAARTAARMQVQRSPSWQAPVEQCILV